MHIRFETAVLFGLLCLNGCGDGSVDADSDADSDSGSDTGSDSELVSCEEVCDSPTCIETISGQVIFCDETPMQGLIQICVPQCLTVTTDQDGRFKERLIPGCLGYDFTKDNKIDVTLVSSERTHAQYSLSFAPTAEEVGDKGQGDYDFDVGTLYLCELPDESAKYTASDGVSVDLSGVRMELLPGALGDEDADIKVYRKPMDQQPPRFDDIGMDALYFISPYWYSVSGQGVELSIEPPDGWQNGDTGSLYMLGDYASDQSYLSSYLECNDEEAPIGEMVQCGSAEMSGGRIVTSPITRFGWVGLKKD